MELSIEAKRLSDNVLATVKEVDGEEYYCLAEILEQLHLKGGWNEKNIPVAISAKIVWGFRFSSLNLLETVFVDKQSALKLIKENNRRLLTLEDLGL